MVYLTLTIFPKYSQKVKIKEALMGLYALVPKVGVEPTRVVSPADFESAASASSATSAFIFVATLILTERENGVNIDDPAGIINRNKGSQEDIRLRLLTVYKSLTVTGGTPGQLCVNISATFSPDRFKTVIHFYFLLYKVCVKMFICVITRINGWSDIYCQKLSEKHGFKMQKEFMK